MARKKMEAIEPKLQPVRVDLEREMHDILRIEAAKERMSMSKFARTTLVRVLRERTGKVATPARAN